MKIRENKLLLLFFFFAFPELFGSQICTGTKLDKIARVHRYIELQGGTQKVKHICVGIWGGE